MAKKVEAPFVPGQYNGVGIDPLAPKPDPIANPFGNHSWLDNMIHGLLGHSTDEMTPARAKEVEAKRARDRKDANAGALSAMKNPGAEYMSAPSIGGSDKGLGDIVKAVAGLFQKGRGL